MILFAKPPRKILIIKPSSLGDIIHSLPFLDCVAKTYPDAEIHWVVAKGLDKVLENHPLLKKLWVINKDNWKSVSNIGNTVAELWSLYRGLRKEKFDVSVDLSGLLRSGLITWMAGARYKIGFKDSDEGSAFFYSHKVESGIAENAHAVDRNLKIARQMGCDIKKIHYPMAPLEANPTVLQLLPENFIVMSPSAGKEANRWPAERFGKVARALPVASVIICSAEDHDVAEKVVAESGGKAISLAGKTSLTELFAVIGKAKCFLSNDTGPMHIAAALQVPVFAVFGPANPSRTGPYGDRHTIISEKLDCAPCYAWKPCDNWRCMEEIKVERVVQEIIRKMEWHEKFQTTYRHAVLYSCISPLFPAKWNQSSKFYFKPWKYAGSMGNHELFF